MMISVDAKRPPLKFNTHLYSYKNTLLYKIKHDECLLQIKIQLYILKGFPVAQL